MAFFNKRKPVTICSINHMLQKRVFDFKRFIFNLSLCLFWMSKSKSKKEFLMRSLSSKRIKEFV